LGDHTETIEIKFDPEVISYEDLLDHFFKQHDPTVVQSTQYRSALFTHNKLQEQAAEDKKGKERLQRGKQIVTAISPVSTFYEAEEYHQKYLAKARGETGE